jgi:hypothetical protein
MYFQRFCEERAMRAYDNRAPSPIARHAMPWTGRYEALKGPSRLALRAADTMLGHRASAATISGRGESRVPPGEQVIRSFSRTAGYVSLAAGVAVIGWLAT